MLTPQDSVAMVILAGGRDYLTFLHNIGRLVTKPLAYVLELPMAATKIFTSAPVP